MGTAIRILTALTLAAPALALASSASAPDAASGLAVSAAEARAEAKEAEARAAQLERAAARATSAAQRLHARQEAAASAIAAAEARITAASARAMLLAAEIEASGARLRREQQPAAALLAGVATMSLRPPLLTLLDERATDELVKAQAILDRTLPAIRARTSALADAVERRRQLQREAVSARLALGREKQLLEQRKRQFAALERDALQLAAERGAEALAAGDVALATGEEAGRIERRSSRSEEARRFATELAELPSPPSRPFEATGGDRHAALRYRLPVAAPIAEGLGAVGPDGVRSRGLTMQTRRGAAVLVPAPGTIRFAGPYRDYDGVVIIDHGGGWTSLLLNVRTAAKPGAKVETGQILGRALGPLGVELSRNGRHFSPALIAGSSRGL